jgi:hypothetical protein
MNPLVDAGVAVVDAPSARRRARRENRDEKLPIPRTTVVVDLERERRDFEFAANFSPVQASNAPAGGLCASR